MVQYENECVSCGLPCIGSACPFSRVPHYYCDECNAEDTLYEYQDDQLCSDCLLKKYKIVEGSEE